MQRSNISIDNVYYNNIISEGWYILRETLSLIFFKIFILEEYYSEYFDAYKSNFGQAVYYSYT